MTERMRLTHAVIKYSDVPVWNGLTNEFHPTQMLADVLTIKEEFGSLEGKTLGKGSCGFVQLALELKTDKKVAAKKIPKKILNDPKQLHLINNEILISTTTLSNEKYLVKTLDLTEIEGEKYMNQQKQRILILMRNYLIILIIII